MTPQAYYDILVSKARDGSFPCVSPNGNCMYRNNEGKACAFGVLIRDDKYVPAMEHSFCNDIINDYPDSYEQVDGFDKHDYKKVQSAHDYCAKYCRHNFVERFIEKLNLLSCFSEGVARVNCEAVGNGATDSVRSTSMGGVLCTQAS